MIRRATLIALLLTSASRLNGLQGQSTPRPVILSNPEATLPDAFSAVRGVRELPSGKVLVADWIEERVVMVDMASGTMEETVSAGPGPDDVRLPSGLVAMGDSTLLLDLGNQRLSVLGPDGRIRRTLRADRPGMVGVKGVDGQGGFFYAMPAWANQGSALPDDSVQVVRWDPGTGESRTVAVVQGTRARKDRSPSREMRLPVIGFAAHDGWTVLADGTLVMVRAGAHRVEVIHPDGRTERGPSYAYATRPVTATDRRAFVESFLASSPMSGRGADGGMGHAPSADEAQIKHLAQTTEFAEVHPPFAPDRVVADPAGQIWVGRPPTPEGRVLYDVFDLTGRRVRQVEFTGDRRLVSVGARGLYVIHEGRFGLQSLERYPKPR